MAHHALHYWRNTDDTEAITTTTGVLTLGVPHGREVTVGDTCDITCADGGVFIGSICDFRATPGDPIFRGHMVVDIT